MTVRHLRRLLGHPAFRSLLQVRLTGQFADGLLQAGLVGVVLFAPERAASPTRIAVGFAVLLLPFTLLAPLAGVLLDRWSRVRVLRWANLLRAGLIAITAVAAAADASEIVIFGSALLALALNRLILAALGASLPRTVPRGLLITGNAFAPTLGAVVTVIGASVGLTLRGVLDTAAAAAPFAAAVVGYLVAAMLTQSFTASQLGPERVRTEQSPLRMAWHDIRFGLRKIGHTIPARRALTITTAQRILFGALMVWTIVVIRFTLHGTRTHEGRALVALGSVALFAGAGLLLASVIAPLLVRHRGVRQAAAIALGVAAIGCATPLVTFRLGAMLVAWLLVGLGAQVVKITVDTVLQRSMNDRLRGRVFIAYDLVFNLAFMLGVAIVAALPLSLMEGAAVPGVAAALYVTAAVAVMAPRRYSSR